MARKLSGTFYTRINSPKRVIGEMFWSSDLHARDRSSASRHVQLYFAGGASSGRPSLADDSSDGGCGLKEYVGAIRRDVCQDRTALDTTREVAASSIKRANAMVWIVSPIFVVPSYIGRWALGLKPEPFGAPARDAKSVFTSWRLAARVRPGCPRCLAACES